MASRVTIISIVLLWVFIFFITNFSRRKKYVKEEVWLIAIMLLINVALVSIMSFLLGRYMIQLLR